MNSLRSEIYLDPFNQWLLIDFFVNFRAPACVIRRFLNASLICLHLSLKSPPERTPEGGKKEIF